ncbi:MAG: SDR family NAD(P)-dependent oxidoreductase [Planctomycetota bacterium]|jgi:NAD(P)-dependent dehydrogenase (short-subunit alcohol dehydrogenase family)
MDAAESRRVALVVGGGRGIGRATAERLARAGHHVVVAARSTDEVEAAAAGIRTLGGSADAVRLDVRDHDACDAAVRGITSTAGPISVLVDCAGLHVSGPVLTGNVGRWRDVLETNVLGAFIISRAVLPKMIRNRWGRIVHIGSVTAARGAPYHAIYAASKAALEGFARSLAQEVASLGITVNVLVPGHVDTRLARDVRAGPTKMLNRAPDDVARKVLVDLHGGQREMTPAEVAEKVAWLVSDAAGTMNGQVVRMDALEPSSEGPAPPSSPPSARPDA